MLEVLFADDEKLVGNSLERLFRAHGIRLDAVSDPTLFWSRVRTGRHHVIGVDECLHGWLPLDRGSAICARLRRDGEARPLLLTSHLCREDEGARLAKECGADRFVVKDHESVRRALEELATLDPKRFAPVPKGEEVYAQQLRVVAGRVFLGDAPVPLKGRQLEVLLYLLRRRGAPVTIEELRREVWRCDVARSAISNVLTSLIDLLPTWVERLERGCYRARVSPS